MLDKPIAGMGQVSKSESLYLQEKEGEKPLSDIVIIDDKIARERLKKRDEKFLKALRAGARLAEVSSSKIAWDYGHDRIEIKGDFDYRIHQVLNCAADLIAQEHWFASVMRPPEKADTQEPIYCLIPISYNYFRLFIDDRNNLSTKDVTKIFDKLAEITLKGKVKIPIAGVAGGWLILDAWKCGICEVGFAHLQEGYEEYRSKRRMRGRGAGNEEPVYVLKFSSEYGKSFYRNAMLREGTQLQRVELYHLKPEVQDLFQAARWKERFRGQRIMINTEQASKMMWLKWPPVNKSNLQSRVDLIRRVLKILRDKGFISYNDETYEIGNTIDKKAWRFYIKRMGRIRSLVKK